MADYMPIDDMNIGPVTPLKIEKPGGGPTDFVKIEGILDTGSPRTYVPRSVVEDLSLRSLEDDTVTGITGKPISVCVYEVNIVMTGREFARREFKGILVFGSGLDKALVGRDILQNFVMIFDGPAREWRLGGPA